VLKLLKLAHFELSVKLTGDSSVRELNRRFRGKDSATDVLSFPQIASAADGNGAGKHRGIDDFWVAIECATARDGRRTRFAALLGDVAISVETAERQAASLGIAPALRMRTLLIHGVLHLLGYDHEASRGAARRQFGRERELAAALAGTGGGEASRPVGSTGRGGATAVAGRRRSGRTGGGREAGRRRTTPRRRRPRSGATHR
jgi:probable rRNA maturation factor